MNKISVQKLKGKFSKERFSVGLDIGTQVIKIARLKFSKDSIELAGFDLEPVSSDLPTLLKTIKATLNVDSVNVGICGPATVIRYVNFPLMDKDELKQALKFEAQKHIPFSVNEINLDSHILKENLPDNKMLVLIAAVKKESINQRLKIIEDAGLKVNVVDIDSIALVNAFNFNYAQGDFVKQKVVALLNIGAELSNLNILEDGLPRLSRDIHIAGNNFTQKIQDVFGVEFKAAEELKRNPDKDRLDKIVSSVEAALSNLASEIRVSFDYYESQSTFTVTKILLSGGGSNFTGLKDMLANLLGIEVEYWEPLKQINVANTIDFEKLKSSFNQLAICLGLALRE